MSYYRNRQSLGDIGSVLSSIGSSISSGLKTAADIGSDPYLPETLCRAQQLLAIEHHQPVGNCVDTPPGLPGGVGLHKVMTPLRALVYAERNPWVYPVAVATVIGVPMLIGYLLGKGSR